jgi:hypothetical protein
LLLAYGERLPFMLATEGFLQEDLRANGHRLCMAADAQTRHLNFSRLRPCVRQSYYGGRLYAAHRVRQHQWSRLKRLLYVGGTPLIPVVRLRRILRDMRRCERQRKLLPRIIPAMSLFLVAHAFGEMAGYAFGAGRSEQQYLNYETLRIRYVTEEDRQGLDAA